ncbi:MAG: ribonuclease HII [Lachnospiraceae bacterium]
MAIAKNRSYETPVERYGSSMEETIGAIKENYQKIKPEALAEFIHQYETDTRAGVAALVKKAQKQIKALDDEKARMWNMFQYERQYAAYTYICGIDEVGRGPLAGPVMAGAVILPKDCDILYLNDSKQLTAQKRDELYDIIMEQALATGIGTVSPKRIDEINILQATYEAMREAIQNLAVVPDILLNDAVTIPQVTQKQIPIIKGDAKSASIAAASIIAKVTRDRLMEQYDSIMPEYGFASHKGYGSASHIAAIRKYGPSPIHRSTFLTNIL